MKQHKDIDRFCELIWDWYARHKRSLPWRDLQIEDDTQRAYMVLVSEIMLQQTQVPRVVIIFKRFLHQFPTLQDLAKASNKDVIIAWRGMGYNSRALRLRDAAKQIIEKFEGKFPTTMDDLRSIKGIGHYTAAAIRNFAFNISTPCLDTNIRRILHRTFVGPENADGTWRKDDKYLLGLAGEVLEVAMLCHFELCEKRQSKNTPRRTRGDKAAAEWHAALMDFGSLVCTKRNPKWDICPLTKAGICKASYKVKTSIARSAKKEPGREVAGRFIPNRIFRGKIIEVLRDSPHGMSLEMIGQHIAIDWNPTEHKEWLQSLVKQLARDNMVKISANRCQLRS